MGTQCLTNGALNSQANTGVIEILGYIDHEIEERTERVLAHDQTHNVPTVDRSNVGDVAEQRFVVALEQLFLREILDLPHEVLAVVTADVESRTIKQYPYSLTQQRNLHGGKVKHRVSEQTQESDLPTNLARRIEFLDDDIVGVDPTMHIRSR